MITYAKAAFRSLVCAPLVGLPPGLALGQVSPGVYDGRVVIGQILALTGPFADLSTELLKGSSAYFAAVNAAGGCTAAASRSSRRTMLTLRTGQPLTQRGSRTPLSASSTALERRPMRRSSPSLSEPGCLCSHPTPGRFPFAVRHCGRSTTFASATRRKPSTWFGIHQALQGLRNFDAGGVNVTFGLGAASATSFVELTMIDSGGRLIK